MVRQNILQEHFHIILIIKMSEWLNKCVEWETAPHFWNMWMNLIDWHGIIFLLLRATKLECNEVRK